MSDIEPNETIDDDLSTYSVDDEDQLQPEDTLDPEDVDDVLDRGYSPAETERGTDAFGTTAYEESQEETIDQRILQSTQHDDGSAAAKDGPLRAVVKGMAVPIRRQDLIFLIEIAQSMRHLDGHAPRQRHVAFARQK